MSKNIYLISCDLPEEKIYKIGYTKRDVTQRVKELKTGNPAHFEIEKVYVAENYGVTIETNLHKHFKDKKLEGEWFTLNDQDVEQFESICENLYDRFDYMTKNNTYLIDRGVSFK